jgi:hypothetical protein
MKLANVDKVKLHILYLIETIRHLNFEAFVGKSFLLETLKKILKIRKMYRVNSRRLSTLRFKSHLTFKFFHVTFDRTYLNNVI